MIISCSINEQPILKSSENIGLVEDSEDVGYLINRYIELIEKDSQITDLQKGVVYSALSTAAYSTNYWYNRAQQ